MLQSSSPEREILLRRLDRQVKKAIDDYGLIDEGDHLLIGLSGGKDSLALVELLGRRSRIFAPRFTLTAAHIRMSNIAYHSDTSALREHCATFGIEYVERETAFDPSTDRRKTPCFLCSWYRRKALFDICPGERLPQDSPRPSPGRPLRDFTHEHSLPRLFCHHASPAGHEEIRHDNNPPALPHRRERPCGVEPLLGHYPRQEKSCPYEKSSHRPEIRNILHQLQAISPQLRGHLWNSMTHIQESTCPVRFPPAEREGTTPTPSEILTHIFIYIYNTL